MSWRGYAESKLAAQRGHDCIDAGIHNALTQPSKADLQSMLREAAQNNRCATRERLMGMWQECTHDCRRAVHMAETGDWEGFAQWLSEYDPDNSTGNDLIDDLLCEARDLVRHGDMGGAVHRIRLFAYPKFHSEAQCRADYNAAMGKES